MFFLLGGNFPNLLSGNIVPSQAGPGSDHVDPTALPKGSGTK